jgi:hypothetical protein
MEADQLFQQHRYMTRMYTRISPSEMTRDPIFLFNPDLPNVSNKHTAIGKAHCKPGANNEVEKVTVTLDDGTVLNYDGPFDNSAPPVLVDDGTLGGPAAAIQRMFTSGDPDDVPEAKVAEVDKEFDSITVGLVRDQKPGGTPSTPRPSLENAATTSGCTAGTSGPVDGIVLLLLMAACGLLVWRPKYTV